MRDRLGHIDPGAEGLAAVLVAALADEDARAQYAAAVTLGSLEKHKDVAIPALTAALQDNDSWVRLGAAQSLWRLQPGDKRVIEVLIPLLNDPEVRNGAAALLQNIDPASAAKAGLR